MSSGENDGDGRGVRDAIIVPLKSFALAKQRLRRGGANDVTALVERLALGVVRHCAPRPVIIVCESRDVEDFALRERIEVRRTSAPGLNEALQRAYRELSDRFDRLIVVHGDLGHPEGLGDITPADGVTIVTDHHGRGTNVLVIPTGLDFHFAYGDDSAANHASEARRLGVTYCLVKGSPWGFDVDDVTDLEGLDE